MYEFLILGKEEAMQLAKDLYASYRQNCHVNLHINVSRKLQL